MSTTTETPAPPAPAPPEPPAPTGPRGRRRGRFLIAAALTAVGLAVGAFLLVGALTEQRSPVLVGPAGAPFRVELPDDWRAASPNELQALPGSPLGVARQTDGRGVLVVRLAGSAPRDFTAFTKRLDREFERRFRDFERKSARTLRVRAGAAYFYSYIRRRRGTVHSVLIVPAGRRSYTLNTVAQGGADDVARQLGRMLVSFDA
jgi:hypothetical protein